MPGIRRLTGLRPKLPDGLGRAKNLLARFKDAKTRKDTWESTLRDAYQYCIPDRETFDRRSPGQINNKIVFDSTAPEAVPRFATRVQGLMMPPWKEFTQFSPGPELPEEVRNNKRLQMLLKEQTEITFGHINQSNMANQVHESFQDLAIGTGAMDCWQGDPGKPLLLFDAVPLADLVLEEGPNSTVENTYREKEPKLGHLERLYPGIQLTDEMKQNMAKDPQKPERIIECLLLDPDSGFTFAIVLSPKSEGSVLWEQAYGVSPRSVYRWSLTPGEIYGRGPALRMLPTIKTANKVVEFILKNAALAVSGVYTSTSDSALNPWTMRFSPATVIPVDSNDSRNPTIRALERSGDIGLGFDVLEVLQNDIKRALLEDQLRPEGPVRSATEIAIEDRERIQTVGSSFGRLQTEVVDSTFKRLTHVLRETGHLAPTLEIDGRTIKLQHTSPLARAQDLDELITLQATMEAVAPLGPEAIAIGLKVEDLPAWVADKTGLDPRLRRDEAERKEMQEQAAELAAQAQTEVAAAA